VLRFVASVLITSGILMLADAGLTLAWQEPVSAFFAAQEQGRLAHKLDVEAAGVVARDKLLVASIRDIRKRLARLGAIERQRARTGDPIGRIKLPTLGRHYVVVQGTDLGTLRKGPGHYPKTVFPGEAGTVAIAGSQTGVYPLPTPGGWHLLGRTSMPMFLAENDPPSLLRPGDRVKFHPI